MLDSQPVFAAGLEAVLSAGGRYRVLPVAGEAGEDVVDSVGRAAPSAVVLDSRLGRLPYGVDLITAMIDRLPSLGVLVSVSAARPLGLADAVRAGARGLIVRDAPPAEWLTAVAAVLRGQEWIGQPLAAMLGTQLTAEESALHLPELSGREKQVLRQVSQGSTNAAIAVDLGLSEYTVRNHVHGLMSKLGASTRTQAVAIARDIGLLDPAPPSGRPQLDAGTGRNHQRGPAD